MQDHLLIADIHPPHLLRGEQQVGFSGKEDENTRLLECFPRELLSVQPGMKPQGGHQKLLTYFFSSQMLKCSTCLPMESSAVNMGGFSFHSWILPRPQSPMEGEEYEPTQVNTSQELPSFQPSWVISSVHVIYVKRKK